MSSVFKESNGQVGQIRLNVLPEEAELLRHIKEVDEPYIVGGYVRDLVMGNKPHDMDVAVRDLNKVKEHLKSLGYNVVDEDIVAKVYLTPSYYVDIAGFRHETYDMKSLKPIISPVNTIEEDLGRRDLTFNAMALRVKDINGNQIDAELVDPYNGREDLEKGIVRFVGNPMVRIMEDPTRMLRALRFSAKYGFDIDDESLQAITQLRDQLKRVPKERINDELTKALLANPSKVLRLLDMTGLLDVLFPGIAEDMRKTVHDHRAHHHGENVVEHTIEALANLQRLHPLNPLNVYAVLLHDIGKPYTAVIKGDKVMFPDHAEKSAELAEKWMREYRFPNKVINTVANAIREHMNIHFAEQNKDRRLLAKIWTRLGEDLNTALLATTIAEADTGHYYDFTRQTFNEFATMPRLVTGLDAIQLGIPAEKRSAWLRKVREIQLARNIRDREELLKIAKGVSV